jgi:hypothetical protein
MSNPNIPDELEDLGDDTSVDHLPPACRWGMAGWCSSGRHQRCYFNTPDGQAASRALTYGLARGHLWVCRCICHEDQDLPMCPHPVHAGRHVRTTLEPVGPVQAALF